MFGTSSRLAWMAASRTTTSSSPRPEVLRGDDAAALVNDASSALRNSGLEVHRRKTRIIPPGARKIVLGLTVLDDTVALPGEFKRRV
jgi:RNA-directed DNA polymerase